MDVFLVWLRSVVNFVYWYNVAKAKKWFSLIRNTEKLLVVGGSYTKDFGLIMRQDEKTIELHRFVNLRL